MRKFFIVASLVVLAIGIALIPGPAVPVRAQMSEMMMGMQSDSSVELRMAMRKLWEDHIIWTRVYIMSTLAGLDDTSAAAQRLLQNQEDLGNAIKPYYGEEAGNALATLLREHITVAVDVVAAAKAGDSAALDDANQRWYANADAIAVFLSGANPNWPEQDLKDMLYKHLELTTNQVIARLNMDWTADIEAYDANHEHMLMMSDALTDGIVKQFPEMFMQ
jgi:hypothetical protein